MDLFEPRASFRLSSGWRLEDSCGVGVDASKLAIANEGTGYVAYPVAGKGER